MRTWDSAYDGVAALDGSPEGHLEVRREGVGRDEGLGCDGVTRHVYSLWHFCLLRKVVCVMCFSTLRSQMRSLAQEAGDDIDTECERTWWISLYRNERSSMRRQQTK